MRRVASVWAVFCALGVECFLRGRPCDRGPGPGCRLLTQRRPVVRFFTSSAVERDSPNGIYGKSARSSVETSSLRLDVGRPDHLAPCFEFRRDSPREFLWRASDRVIAEALLHFRQRDYLDDLAMEGGDDLLWRSGWNEDPNPTVALDVRITHFSHRWNIGHCLGALLARDRQRPQLAVLDIRCNRSQRREADRGVASDDGGVGWTCAIEGHVHEVEAE